MGTPRPRLADFLKSAAAAAIPFLLAAQAFAQATRNPLAIAASSVSVINFGTRNAADNSSIDLEVPFSGVAGGASIILTVQVGGAGGPISCSDPKNGAYSVDVSVQSAIAETAIASKHNVVALSFGDAITCTYPEFSGASSIGAYEVAGLSPGATLDQTAGAASSGAGVLSSGLTSLTAQADELVFGFVWTSNFPPTQTFTPATSGGNPLENPYSPNFTALMAAGSQRPMYRFVHSVRQYEVNGTVGGEGQAIALVATYRLAADLCAGVSCNDSNPCTVDSCDSSTGSCVHAAGNSGSTCRAAQGECDLRERCDGINPFCPADRFVASGEPCGDSEDTGDCNHADSCNGLGVCENNRAEDGTACGDPGTACVNQDVCLDGVCRDQGFAPPGAACGDSSSGPCDAADSCNGSGDCNANVAADGSACGDSGTACVNQDTCVSGACQDQGFAPPGTACGDSSSGPCDAADGCDGSGACLANPAPAGTACDDEDVCTASDACDGAGACAGGPSPAEACGNGADEDCDGQIDEGCDDQGPVTTLTMASPNPVSVSSTTTLTANVDDATTGGSTIASAAYDVDGGAWQPMQSHDGAFDEVGEDVVAYALAFPSTGVYRLCVHGTDASSNTGGEDCTYLAVYDPNAGFVSGGGWIHSPAGAYPPNPELGDKAHFAFVAKYPKGAKAPVGEAHFKLSTFRFEAADFEWLVISGAKARAQGSGKVDGSGDYGFLITAWDGQAAGGDGVDRLRIKIWNKATSSVVYDSQPGAGDNDQPTTALGGGNILIHKK